MIGVRSFGADPTAVAALAAAQVKGYQGAGIASTAKHFPGHGDTGTDSHFSLPIITHTLEQWQTIDAPPFRAAIAAGIDSIMTAHILVPALDDSGDPATLSYPILTGVLREQLGYDGVVVTDALDMAGVREKYGDARVPVLALKAGADQLLNPPLLPVAYQGVMDAVASGELTEERIEVSLERILALKLRKGLFRNPFVTHAGVDRVVGTRAHLAAADRITERGITLLANDQDALPLPRRSHRDLLVVGADPAAPSGTGGPPTGVLAKALTDLGHTAQALSTGTAPTQAVIDMAVAAAAGKDAVIVCTYNVTSASTGQIALVTALAAAAVPVVTVAVRNPYDIACLPPVAASLATYGWTDVSMRAVARVIMRQGGTGRAAAGRGAARRRPGDGALPDRLRPGLLAGPGCGRTARQAAARTSPVKVRHSSAYRPPRASSASCVPSSTTFPWSRTTTRSARAAVLSRCATTSVVRRVASRSAAWLTSASVARSSAAVASSSSRIAGSTSSARASAISCRW